jgi:Cu(I)/Ag(I) efflux system periplasmic protein CusF
MKKLTQLALLAALATSASTWAQHVGAPMDKSAAPKAATAANENLAEGVVRTVDKAARKITIRHGEIKNLDMMPMTMVFHVNNPALLDKVKAGDKILFTAEEIKGVLVVQTLEVVRK